MHKVVWSVDSPCTKTSKFATQPKKSSLCDGLTANSEDPINMSNESFAVINNVTRITKSKL